MTGRPRPAPEPLKERLPAAKEAVAELLDAPERRILTPRTGHLVGVEGGQLLVDYPGNVDGPLPARSTVPLDAKSALQAAVSRRGAVLVFDDGDPRAPIVIGLLQPSIPTLLDLVLEGSGEADGGDSRSNGHEAAGANSHSPDAASNSHSPSLDTAASNSHSRGGESVATVDGERVVVEGQEEVSLRCGAASITLRRDGRVVVRGAYVETHASGTNRIKGGSVRIN